MALRCYFGRRFYIKICVQLAELIENTSKDKDKVKKMSKTNAKSLNAMKQNIKKNNIQYEDEIKKYMEVKNCVNTDLCVVCNQCLA